MNEDFWEVIFSDQINVKKFLCEKFGNSVVLDLVAQESGAPSSNMT